ncbi:MAG: glycogen/starch synthase [Bacteroidales bacterium]|nr:glycogen/starch synthase [Bacteroidales bacterium]
MENAKILYVSQEIMPYLPESEISRISRNLPEGVMQFGKEVRTFMPRFGNVNERRNQLHEVIRLSGMNIIIDDNDHPLLIKVASIQAARMQIYFIDNDDFFERKATFTDADGNEFDDNDERAIFFARGVLETARKLRWESDLIHLHGWFTAFIPVFAKYLMKDDPHFNHAKYVVSLYNNEFYKQWDGQIERKLFVDGIDTEAISQIKANDYVSLMKMVIDFADGIVLGSTDVNPELIEYAKSQGKPIMEYHPEDQLAEACNKFYDQILG